jgi:hypothetical protein
VKPHIIVHGGLGIVCIPKVGNTSIKAAFLDVVGRTDGVRIHRDKNAPLFSIDDMPTCELHAFIRNPIDRLVSCWGDKVAARGDSLGKRNMMAIGYRHRMSFPDFVRHVQKRRDDDLHTMPQSRFVPECATLHRFENIGDVWPQIQARYDWLPSLQRLNTSSRKPQKIGRETKIIIESLYEHDFRLWRGIS